MSQPGTGVIQTQGASISLGTGTTKTEITPSTGIQIPNSAYGILGVQCLVINPLPTAAQSVTAKLEVESSDIKPSITPFEALFPPVGSGLGATYPLLNTTDTWQMNAVGVGGAIVHVYGQALVANTNAVEGKAWMHFTDNPLDMMQLGIQGGRPAVMQKQQRWSKVGTLTATGVTEDSDVAGSAFKFSGARAVTEWFGVFHPKTIAANDGLTWMMKYASSELDTTYDQLLPGNPMSFGLGATGAILIPGVSRHAAYVPTKTSGQVNVQEYFRFSGTLGTAGSFVAGAVFV